MTFKLLFVFRLTGGLLADFGILLTLTHAVHLDSQQASQLLDFVRDMPDADGTVVRGRPFRPRVHKSLGSEAEAVTAVGIANLKNRSLHRLAFRNLQHYRAIPALNH